MFHLHWEGITHDPSAQALPINSHATPSQTDTPSSCADIASSLSAGGRRVQPVEGTYDCSSSQLSMADDTWLDMSDGTTINVDGNINWSNLDGVRISGGNIAYTGAPGFIYIAINDTSDITIDNINIDWLNGNSIFMPQLGTTERIAILHVKLETGGFGFYSGVFNGEGLRDYVIAGIDAYADNNLSIENSGSLLRLQSTERGLIAASRWRNRENYGHNLFRLWWNQQDIMVVDNHTLSQTSVNSALNFAVNFAGRQGTIDDIRVDGNYWYVNDTGQNSSLVTVAVTTGCGNICTDFDMTNNFLVSDPAATSLNIASAGQGSCSGLTESDTTFLDFSDEGGFPTCAEIGCGPDH